MRDTATETVTETAAPTGPVPVGRRGRTMIADRVVAAIVGTAAREVDGVHDLGGASERAVGLLHERVPVGRLELAPGVSVEVGDMRAAVDLQIVADHGIGLPDLSAAVRRNVVAAVESMTGLRVTEVNVSVADLHVVDGRRA